VAMGLESGGKGVLWQWVWNLGEKGCCGNGVWNLGEWGIVAMGSGIWEGMRCCGDEMSKSG